MQSSAVLLLSSLAVASGLMNVPGSLLQTEAASTLSSHYHTILAHAAPITKMLEREFDKASKTLKHVQEHPSLEKDVKKAEREFGIANAALNMAKEMCQGVEEELMTKLKTMQLKGSSFLETSEKDSMFKIDWKAWEETEPMKFLDETEKDAAKTIEHGIKKEQQAMSLLSEAASAKDEPLPKGWESADDPKSGKEYYFHRDSGVRQWEHPAVLQQVNSSEPLSVAQIYWINPSMNGHRIDFMTNELANKAPGIPNERFQGVTREELGDQQDTEFSNGQTAAYLVGWGGKPRWVTHAIYVSHMRMIKKIADDYEKDHKKNGPVMIMEDDARLHDDWKSVTEGALKDAPMDWDVIRVGFWGGSSGFGNDITPQIKRACCYDKTSGNGQEFLGMQAYIVKPSGAANILKAMKDREVLDIDKAILEHDPEGSHGPQLMHVYATPGSVADHGDIGGGSRWSLLDQRQKKTLRVGA